MEIVLMSTCPKMLFCIVAYKKVFFGSYTVSKKTHTLSLFYLQVIDVQTESLFFKVMSQFQCL